MLMQYVTYVLHGSLPVQYLYYAGCASSSVLCVLVRYCCRSSVGNCPDMARPLVFVSHLFFVTFTLSNFQGSSIWMMCPAWMGKGRVLR